MPRKKRPNHIIRDYTIAIGGAIALAFTIRYFFIEAYRMPSRAMIPTVEAGDTLFVSKRAYGWRIPFSKRRVGGGQDPNYGDVVVLEFADEPKREYIKRVVGRPGDRVAFRKGRLVLNGEDRAVTASPTELCGKESLPSGKTYPVCWEPPVMDDVGETTLAPGEFFVIGDLRTQVPEARRLRLHGKVRLENIRGRAKFIWLSVNTPQSTSGGGDLFSRIRFDRLFNRIE